MTSSVVLSIAGLAVVSLLAIIAATVLQRLGSRRPGSPEVKRGSAAMRSGAVEPGFDAATIATKRDEPKLLLRNKSTILVGIVAAVMTISVALSGIYIARRVELSAAQQQVTLNNSIINSYTNNLVVLGVDGGWQASAYSVHGSSVSGIGVELTGCGQASSIAKLQIPLSSTVTKLRFQVGLSDSSTADARVQMTVELDQTVATTATLTPAGSVQIDLGTRGASRAQLSLLLEEPCGTESGTVTPIADPHATLVLSELVLS